MYIWHIGNIWSKLEELTWLKWKGDRKRKIEKYFKSSCLRELKTYSICLSFSGDAEAVESILSFLTNNPEPQNKDFKTPLDLALQAGYYHIIREVYENLEILSPEPQSHQMYNIHEFEDSMEEVE